MPWQAGVVSEARTLHLAGNGIPVGIARISPKHHISRKVGIGIGGPLQCHGCRRSSGCKSLRYGWRNNLACGTLRQELP